MPYGWCARHRPLRAPSRPGSITGAPVAAFTIPQSGSFSAAAHEGASGRRDAGSHQPPALCARAAPYYPRSLPSLCSVVGLTISHARDGLQAARAMAYASSPSTCAVSQSAPADISGRGRGDACVSRPRLSGRLVSAFLGQNSSTASLRPYARPLRLRHSCPSPVRRPFTAAIRAYARLPLTSHSFHSNLVLSPWRHLAPPAP